MTFEPLLRLMVILTFAFGFTALLIDGSLAFAIALGQVKQDSSYGLLNVLGSLNTALGAFVGFALGSVMWNFVLHGFGKPTIEPPKDDAKVS